MSFLNQLTSITSRKSKRVGRGYGCGKGGHTSGKGQKGQNSRRGGGVAMWFEGGQLPIIKRMPMQRGKSRFNVVRPTAEITLSDLQKMKAETISFDTLKLEKLTDSRFKKAKIIATGKIERAVTISGIKVTPAAQKAIKAAGGKVL